MDGKAAMAAQDTVGHYRLDLTRLLYMFYMDLEQQIARADMKANLILTANSILLAATVTLVASSLRSVASALESLHLLLMTAPTLLFTGIAANYALSVAYPRMAGGAYANAPGRMFQSMVVAAMPLPDYLNLVLGAELEQVKREVLRWCSRKKLVTVNFPPPKGGGATGVDQQNHWQPIGTTAVAWYATPRDSSSHHAGKPACVAR